jgi:hypothetical protein
MQSEGKLQLVARKYFLITGLDFPAVLGKRALPTLRDTKFQLKNLMLLLVKTSSLLQLAIKEMAFNIFIQRHHGYVFHVRKHMNIQYPSARNMLRFLLIIIITIIINGKWIVSNLGHFKVQTL